MKLLIKLRHLLEKDKSYHLKKCLEIGLTSHQHFVEKREKKMPSILEKKRDFLIKKRRKRDFLIKKMRKRDVQFPFEETKTHRHYSTIDPIKLVRYQYRLNIT